MSTAIITQVMDGITFSWSLSSSGDAAIESGTFWDGTPYVVAAEGLKVTDVDIVSQLGAGLTSEKPCRIANHELNTFSNGTKYYGNLYLNGLVKNPRAVNDVDSDSTGREGNGQQFDNRYFGVFSNGWTPIKHPRSPKTTDDPTAYGTGGGFNLEGFLTTKNQLETTGIGLAAHDVVMVAKSNYDPNNPRKYSMNDSTGYPYQKHLSRSCVLGFGVLFVLAAHPAGGGQNYFRPPVLWPQEDRANRPLHLLSAITPRVPNRGDSSDMADIRPTLAAGTWGRGVFRNLGGQFINFCYGFPFGGGITYSQVLPLYPAYGEAHCNSSNSSPSDAYGAYFITALLVRLTAIYADRSAVFLSDADRLKALRSIVQWGIDAFGSIKSFSGTQSGAGQRPCVARPWSIIAGWFLGVEDMRAPETTMLYGSYAPGNPTNAGRPLTARGAAWLNTSIGTETKTLRGYRSVAEGGTDGLVITKENWFNEVYGHIDTEVGRKRRAALMTSLESVCYFKVGGDPQSRVLYYKNLGRARNRTFTTTNAKPLTVSTSSVDEAIRIYNADSNASQRWRGIVGKLQWSENPFPTGWPASHDGKSPTIRFCYIRVKSDPGSNTSTTTNYRILKCDGDFRSSDPGTGGKYTLYLDRDWVGGTPSSEATFEMMAFTEENVGDIIYMISVNWKVNGALAAFVEANPNPTTIYGGICYPILLTLYSWIRFAKNKLNGGQPVDLDENSTFAHEFLEQITRKMPYAFYEYSTKSMASLYNWERPVLGWWLGEGNPALSSGDPDRFRPFSDLLSSGATAVALEFGASGWAKLPGVKYWLNGVYLPALSFNDDPPPQLPTPDDFTDAGEQESGGDAGDGTGVGVCGGTDSGALHSDGAGICGWAPPTPTIGDNPIIRGYNPITAIKPTFAFFSGYEQAILRRRRTR